MKVSYNWLKEFVDFDLTPQQLADKLTMAGLEVEEIHAVLPVFSGVIVGYVQSVEKHPDADKLSICSVDTGSEVLQVICGAPNVAVDQKIAFAPIGTDLPVGLKIKKAKIRGVESFGMICSEEELGLAEKSGGIWVLPQSFEIGAELYPKLADMQDYVLDVFITPNRPDAMSMIGIAREVGAILSVPYKKPVLKRSETEESAKNVISVEINNPDGCPRYAARVIRNVKLGPSPAWLADRLKAGGIRPINNVVDITNFVLLELGQPLHAFDLSRVAGNRIVVRDSRKSEKFTTLDEKERVLPDNTVLICDTEKAVAIGGIMGGLNSEVSETTTDILLESAYFNPSRIGPSSKKLGLSSEASQRFERGVDPNGIPFACDRAAFLLAEIAGGQVLKGMVDECPGEFIPLRIPTRTDRVNHLLGTNLEEKQVAHVLKGLEVELKNGIATVPTFRPDLTREVDLIEEVARLIGFDAIPAKQQTNIEYDTPQNDNEVLYQRLKTEISSLGFYEVLTNSMFPKRELPVLKEGTYLEIINPISDDMNVMRQSLIPGLLKVAAYNINRSRADMRLFELGRIFYGTHEISAKNQPYHLAGLIHGSRQTETWSQKSLPIDFYDIKGIAESFLGKIFLDKVEFILYAKTLYFDSEQSLKITCGDEELGQFGRIDPVVARRFDIESDVFGFELAVDQLKQHINFKKFFEAFSRFPFVEKDLALVVDKRIQSAEVEQLIMSCGKPLVTEVKLFDLFERKQLGDDKKSLAFRIRFQSPERTLNEKEVMKLFTKIILEAESKLNANLRN
ncbi:MAG: phenylalanine--tRNA ligase subunit beta [Calditrichales bacterium]|nr:MAG: phenylalanine--tRNA ligase subunit beta [Calditrichales bacterium]